MIGVAAVIAEKRRIVAAVVGGDVDVAIVVKIGGSQSTAGDRAAEVWTERAVGNLFELPLA